MKPEDVISHRSPYQHQFPGLFPKPVVETCASPAAPHVSAAERDRIWAAVQAAASSGAPPAEAHREPLVPEDYVWIDNFDERDF